MIQSGLLSVLLLGFTLGIKHATEPDHVIAVSTIASQTKKLSRSSLAGVFWGLGHTATLLVIGVTAIALGQHIPENVATLLEFFVGVMLVYLGIMAFAKTLLLKKENNSIFTKNHLLLALFMVLQEVLRWFC